MDFNYSAEDEAFRREFRAWLEHNAPHHTVPPLDGMSDEGEDDWTPQNRMVSQARCG